MQQRRSLGILLLSVLLFAMTGALPAAAAVAGAPAVVWEDLIGGDAADVARSADRTVDGGYILLGESWGSRSGDISGPNHGRSDLWLVKLRQNGTIQWERLLGGLEDEHGQDVLGTADGGCLVAATTASSANGDVTGTNHGNLDSWIVKLDAAGGVQWQTLLGGDLDDTLGSITPTTDGGYVLGGVTYSSESGTVTQKSHGRSDVWVVKLGATGNLLWQHLYGGEYWESGGGIRPTADGGFTLSAMTQERNGVVTEFYDLWLLRLDQNGLLLWDRIMGGSAHEYGGTMLPTADGGYLVAGTTKSSANGDVAPSSHGDYDLWVVKLNAARDVQWQRLYGGSGWDELTDIHSTPDGGYVLLSRTDSSASGNVTGMNHGQNDLWLARMDASGAILWQRLIGGALDERAATLLQAADGGHIIVTTSTSSDSGDVRDESNGAEDIWAVRLDREVVPVPGGTGLPRDSWDIRYYDDVNGNGRQDFADVVLFFNQMAWIAANEPVTGFDYNGNGRIDFADVVLLFKYL